MIGVQCIGKKAVLERFETLDNETWAIYQGKQFIVSGSGADQLGAWVDSFTEAGSTATYMLRVYEGDEKPTSSSGNTDYIACIGFKAVDQYEGYGIAGHNNKLMERIAGLEKIIKEQEENEEGGDLNSIIMGWLTDPVKLNQVAGAVRTMLGSGGQQALPATPVQTVSGFNNNTASVSQDPVTRVATALDILEKKDPKLVEHLEKLSKLAVNDPLIFQGVLSKLDAL